MEENPMEYCAGIQKEWGRDICKKSKHQEQRQDAQCMYYITCMH